MQGDVQFARGMQLWWEQVHGGRKVKKGGTSLRSKEKQNRWKQVLFCIGPLCDQMNKSSLLSIAAVRKRAWRLVPDLNPYTDASLFTCVGLHSFLKFSSSIIVIYCASQTSLIIILRSCLTVQLNDLMTSRLKAGSPMSCHVGLPSVYSANSHRTCVECVHSRLGSWPKWLIVFPRARAPQLVTPCHRHSLPQIMSQSARPEQSRRDDLSASCLLAWERIQKQQNSSRLRGGKGYLRKTALQSELGWIKPDVPWNGQPDAS